MKRTYHILPDDNALTIIEYAEQLNTNSNPLLIEDILNAFTVKIKDHRLSEKKFLELHKAFAKAKHFQLKNARMFYANPQKSNGCDKETLSCLSRACDTMAKRYTSESERIELHRMKKFFTRLENSNHSGIIFEVNAVFKEVKNNIEESSFLTKVAHSSINLFLLDLNFKLIDGVITKSDKNYFITQLVNVLSVNGHEKMAQWVLRTEKG